jgi:hypothetical protein
MASSRSERLLFGAGGAAAQQFANIVAGLGIGIGNSHFIVVQAVRKRLVKAAITR